MKVLRKVSLEGLDSLSNQEKARLYGGTGNDSIPPVTQPITFAFTPDPPTPPITVKITPSGGEVGVTVPIKL